MNIIYPVFNTFLLRGQQAVQVEWRAAALWQRNTASGDAARCYFTGPQDENIVMSRGSAQYWSYQQGPVR